MLTVSQLIGRMTHALGKTPDSRHSLYDSLNQAGRAFYSAAMVAPWHHDWTWIVKADITLTIPANAQFVDLPIDFGSPLEVGYETDTAGCARIVSQEEMHRARRSVTDPAELIYLCFEVGSSQPNRTAAPRSQVEVWPVDSSERSDVRISYRRVWPEYTAADGNLIPFYPAEAEELLMLLALSAAYKNEHYQPWPRDADIPAVIDRLVHLDALRTPLVVPVEHSAMRMVRARGPNTADLDFTVVTRP